MSTPTAMAAPHSLSDIDALKRQARARARIARARCDPAGGAALAAHVLGDLAIPPGATISGFWPMAGEIDLRPLLTALHGRGHAILLPETPPLGQPLMFRHWQPGAAMIGERFGTCRPDGPPGVPDLLFVPLLAFDRSGRRLGYGGGYYDRTLDRLPRAIAIGAAFAAQELDAVPAEAHDVVLHAVATERGITRFRDF